MFTYYTLNIWRMVSCGGDVALAFRDRTICLSPPSYKLFERVAVRPAIDVANATAKMPKLSFGRRQERQIESLSSDLKSGCRSQIPTFPGWQNALVHHDNSVLDESKTWPSQAQEDRKPLHPEQLDTVATGALFVASLSMAKCLPARFPNTYIYINVYIYICIHMYIYIYIFIYVYMMVP